MSNLDQENSVVVDGKNVEEMLLNAAENAALQSEEDQKEQETKIGERWHESHTDRRAISSILRKYKDGSIKLPACQRLYTWQEKERKSLLRTAKKGYGCGCLSLGTHEGDSDEISYLVDGQQRIISMMLLSNDESLTKEERKIILDYPMPIVTVYQLSWEEMAEWFVAINSGIAVSAATKNNAKLPANLRDLGNKIASCDFFRDIADKANTTFTKNEHNKVIAWNILLACAGVKADSLKSADITNRLTKYEADVIDNADQADQISNRFANIYTMITDDGIIKRSLNANFLSILAYVLHDSDYTDSQVATMISTIFKKGKAIPEYSNTTGRSAATPINCQRRYEVLVDLLNNVSKNEDVSDDEMYHAFCKDKAGKVITTGNGNYPCDFSEFDDKEREELFLAKDNQQNWNELVTKKYHTLEKEEDIAS